MARPSESCAIEFVTREARRAWDQVAPGLRRRGILEARRRWPNDREIPRALEGARLAARSAAAEFSLIPMRRIRMAPLNAQGADVELERIFGRSAA
jgi:hypothetical protein